MPYEDIARVHLSLSGTLLETLSNPSFQERVYGEALAQAGPPGERNADAHRRLSEAQWRLLRAETSCNFFWGEAWLARCHKDLDDA